VVDGDKLPALAKRYLGSADRFREIYEANRAVLNSPDLLPIGVELVIPPREPAPADRTAPPASTPGPQPTLVPVESLPDES
jgi:phage tail protein X